MLGVKASRRSNNFFWSILGCILSWSLPPTAFCLLCCTQRTRVTGCTVALNSQEAGASVLFKCFQLMVNKQVEKIKFFSLLYVDKCTNVHLWQMYLKLVASFRASIDMMQSKKWSSAMLGVATLEITQEAQMCHLAHAKFRGLPKSASYKMPENF